MTNISDIIINIRTLMQCNNNKFFISIEIDYKFDYLQL